MSLTSIKLNTIITVRSATTVARNVLQHISHPTARKKEIIVAIIENVLKNESGDNITVYIEVDEEHLAAPTRGTGPSDTPKSLLPRLAQDAFTKAMGLIQTCAEQVSSTVKAIPEDARPRQFEVQFAVKIDAEFGAMLAKSSTTAQLQVTLTWGERSN